MDSTFLTHVVEDSHEFFAALHFLRPAWLWLLLVIPVFWLLESFAHHRRQRAQSALGREAALVRLKSQTHRTSLWRGLCHTLAWCLLILGIAGPCWGTSRDTGIAVGRDLVIVVDLSRSMRAQDMTDHAALSRWEAARAGLRDLLDAVAARGGHRVAVIVFAARPKLLCPLTTDYDHIRAIIEELNGDYPPPECRPGPGDKSISGTRIGAALTMAVSVHDERFPGSHDILLLSDGDDPGGDDEWKLGADAARQARPSGIPVHVVGIGDPLHASGIEILEGAEITLVLTKLEETPLREIAESTGGHYEAARRETPRLGSFFRERIEPMPSRTVSDELLPQPRERYSWLLSAALVLWVIGWLIGMRIR